MAKPKGYNESFARFFENPTRDGFRELLKTNHGESRQCDFKSSWPEATALSRHMLGLANSGGGVLVIGVSETGDGALESSGLKTLRDKADVTNAIKNYLPDYLLGSIDVVDFCFDASEYPALVGKRFQVVFVEDEPTHLPFLATRDGKGLRCGAVYVRREGMTEEASNNELQAVINRRLETGHSTRREIDLKTHLDQLRALYACLNRQNSSLQEIFENLTMGMSTPNPNYPKEDFEAFVLRMIRDKKLLIQAELGGL